MPISQIATNQLEPNPLQPRGNISPESIQDLVESIKEHGILEPLIVAQTPAGYQIIAGERRWRAARILKLSHVPAVIKKTSPQQMLEMAIVENVQREDLNPIERARAFLRLKEEFNLDHKQISKKVGKSIPYVINVLKLLSLPDAIKDGLLSGLITEGHGRALASIGDTRLIIEAYKIVLKEKASVRKTEEIARRFKQKIEEGQVPLTKENIPQFLKSKLDTISLDLNKLFDDKKSTVSISQSNITTRIIFEFKGPADQRLERLGFIYQKLLNKELNTSLLAPNPKPKPANT